MKLIVGLGNPGDKYLGTRHNLGFEILDEFVRKYIVDRMWSIEGKFKSEIITSDKLPTINDKLILAKPQTYMNNSGQAVSLIKNFFKIDPADIVIVHDDLDLPLGKIKIRLGGAAAGHHGVESIINSLGTDKFVRIRLGIGNLRTQSAEHGGQHFNADKFVLETFMPGEKSKLKHMVKQAIKALDNLLSEGLEKAQNQFN